MKGSKHLNERHQSIGCRTAEFSRMDGMVKSFYGHNTGDLAPQCRIQDRFTGHHLSHIRNNEHVAVEEVRVGISKCPKVTYRLLLTLDNNLNADREPARECPDGTRDTGNPRLVIRSPPAVQPPVLVDRCPRAGIPSVFSQRRLDIIMCIQEYCRCSRRRRDISGHGGVTPGNFEQTGIHQTIAPQEICCCVCHAQDRFSRISRKCDRRYGNKCFEIPDDIGQECADIPLHCFDERAIRGTAFHD